MVVTSLSRFSCLVEAQLLHLTMVLTLDLHESVCVYSVMAGANTQTAELVLQSPELSFPCCIEICYYRLHLVPTSRDTSEGSDMLVKSKCAVRG